MLDQKKGIIVFVFAVAAVVVGTVFVLLRIKAD